MTDGKGAPSSRNLDGKPLEKSREPSSSTLVPLQDAQVSEASDGPSSGQHPNQSPLPADLDLDRFWEASAESARPAIDSLRKRLPYFPSPPLRIQRVGQLDANLLDQELLELLLAPLKESLTLIKVSLAF